MPAFLFRQINKYINNTLLTQQILSIFLNRIYLDIMHLIWKPRCDEVIRLKKHYNIDKKHKKQKKTIANKTKSDDMNLICYKKKNLDLGRVF